MKFTTEKWTRKITEGGEEVGGGEKMKMCFIQLHLHTAQTFEGWTSFHQIYEVKSERQQVLVSGKLKRSIATIPKQVDQVCHQRDGTMDLEADSPNY